MADRSSTQQFKNTPLDSRDKRNLKKSTSFADHSGNKPGLADVQGFLNDIKEEPEPTSPTKAGGQRLDNRPNSRGRKAGIDVIGIIDDQEELYDQNVRKMNENIDHYCHHYDQRIKKKICAGSNCNCRDSKLLRPDKLEVLRDENIHLKSRKKDLEEKVKIIATKLKRQINTLRKDRLVGGGKSSVSAMLEEDLDRLIEENIRLQDEESILMAKVKKLQMKRKSELKDGKNLYSVHESAQMQRANKMEREQLQMIHTLKTAVEGSHKQIIKLKSDIEDSRRIADSSLNVTDLANERRKVELKFMETKSRVEDIRAQLQVKKDFIGMGQSAEQDIQRQYDGLITQREQVEIDLRTLQVASGQTDDLKAQLRKEREATAEAQTKFKSLMNQPFFRKESNETNLKQLSDLKNHLDKRDTDIKNTKTNFLKLQEELKDLQEQKTKFANQRDTYSEEITKMKAHLDPTSLNLNDVMKKLKQEDPSRFRDVMADLEYEGNDPKWYQNQVMEQIRAITGEERMDENDIKSIIKQKEKEMEERAQLATALSRVQKMLQLQVDIDKQNASLQQAELGTVKSSITGANKKVNELTQKIAMQNSKLLTLQKTVGTVGLTEADLSRFNQNMRDLKTEAMTADIGVHGIGGMRKEFDQESMMSVYTDESEILPTENLLDLRITTANFKRQQVSMIVNRELMPAQVQTFLSVDFYNHDSKNTDMTESYEPVVNTLFSFKNVVDDFYIKHLEQDHILVDVFMAPPRAKENSVAQPRAFRLGQAKLPLTKLIENDKTMQSQEIINYEKDPDNPINVGVLFYMMRMRKSLQDALKYRRAKENLKLHSQQMFDSKGGIDEIDAADDIRNKKIVEICVQQGKNFIIHGSNSSYGSQRMLPFFSYDFYSFEVRSATSQGNNPVFDARKQFEVHANQDFEEYMNTQVLKIDFIDESVDMSQPGVRDYIGSARISLRELKVHKKLEKTFELFDEERRACGSVYLSLRIYDAKEYAYNNTLDSYSNVAQSKMIINGVVTSIVNKFARAGLEDIDHIIGMLFMKDNSGQQRVTRAMFKEFVLQDMSVEGLNENQVDIFLKTHDLLSQRELISKHELRAIFEFPFMEARNRLIEEEAHLPGPQYGVTRGQQDYMKRSTGFGGGLSGTGGFAESLEPKKPYDRDTSVVNIKPNKTLNEEQLGSLGTRDQNKYGDVNTTDLEAVLKNRLYDVITSFKKETDDILPGASLSQSTHVLSKFYATAPNKEEVIKAFFNKYAIGDLFYYQDTLNYLFNKNQGGNHINRQKRDSKTAQNLVRIKKKLYKMITEKKYSLDDFFAILDKNQDKELSLSEMLTGLKDFLDEDDITELFAAVDIDKSGSVTVDELRSELDVINAAYVLDQIKKTCDESAGGNSTIDKLFETIDDDESGHIDVLEFSKLVNIAYRETGKSEVDLLFKLVDKYQRGYLTKEDFKNAFEKSDFGLDAEIFITPNDILWPLYQKLVRRNTTQLKNIFNTFQQDGFITIDQLMIIINTFLGYKITDSEMALVGFYMTEKSGRNDGKLTATNFEKLLMDSRPKKSLGSGDSTIAKETLKRMKRILGIKRKELISELEKYQSAGEVSEKEINIRTFKHFAHIVFNLKPFEVDNLIEYLDTANDGFIKTLKIQQHLQ